MKSPEMSWLAPLVFWYLHVHKSKIDSSLVIPDEEEVYRARFADTAVSHLLFFGLAKKKETLPPGVSFVTFRAVRRFSDIALEGDESFPLLLPDGDNGERRLDEDEQCDWEAFLQRRVLEHRRRRRENTLDVGDYAPFVYLCANVGVAMCYAAPVGHYGPLVAAGTGEGAHFLLPRIEVAVMTKAPDKGEVHLRTLLTWMATGGGEFDHGHTHPAFDTGREPGLPILVPDVIVAAHEAATFARDKISEGGAGRDPRADFRTPEVDHTGALRRTSSGEVVSSKKGVNAVSEWRERCTRRRKSSSGGRAAVTSRSGNTSTFVSRSSPRNGTPTTRPTSSSPSS